MLWLTVPYRNCCLHTSLSFSLDNSCVCLNIQVDFYKAYSSLQSHSVSCSSDFVISDPSAWNIPGYCYSGTYCIMIQLYENNFSFLFLLIRILYTNTSDHRNALSMPNLPDKSDYCFNSDSSLKMLLKCIKLCFL